nr:MAG TPA: hypothetical protein [Caudoviricetes sp.]
MMQLINGDCLEKLGGGAERLYRPNINRFTLWYNSE